MTKSFVTLICQVIKEKTIPGYKSAYSGLVDVAKKTWKINGATSMFQGMLGPRLQRFAYGLNFYSFTTGANSRLLHSKTLGQTSVVKTHTLKTHTFFPFYHVW